MENKSNQSLHLHGIEHTMRFRKWAYENGYRLNTLGDWEDSTCTIIMVPTLVEMFLKLINNDNS